MADDLSFTVEIPCDDEGYVLLQCPQCSELFKLKPSDYESDDVAEICCPACGIASDNYITDDVLSSPWLSQRTKPSQCYTRK